MSLFVGHFVSHIVVSNCHLVISNSHIVASICYYVIRSRKKKCHTNHFRPNTEYMCTSYVQLTQEQKTELLTIVEGSADISFIRTLMYNKFEIVLNDNTIKSARQDVFNKTLEEIGIDPSASACDRLLAFYRCRKDISFISVTHSIQSGFVTMKKDINDSSVNNISKDVIKLNSDALHIKEIESWRKTLNVDGGKRILVAFAWTHHEEKRKANMFPEVFSADVTFGICKEQRNLFRICGVDGNLKVFNAMNCFMPSKQFRAYDWAINIAFPKLVGVQSCHFNSLFTSDQEMALVLSIRKFVNDSNEKSCESSINFPAPNSCHRFDMFHIFTKEWRSKVSYFVQMNKTHISY